MEKEVNPILKHLPKDIRYKKIVGCGYFGVCLDNEEEKPLGKDKKLFRIVSIITAQHDQDKKKVFATKKEKLKQEGVHVLLSGNFRPVFQQKEIVNDQVKEECLSHKVKFGNPEYYNKLEKSSRIVLYDEEMAKGQTFYLAHLEDYPSVMNFSQEHLNQLFHDAFLIAREGLNIDFVGQNIFYEPSEGFYFIDLEYLEEIDDEESIEQVKNFIANSVVSIAQFVLGVSSSNIKIYLKRLHDNPQEKNIVTNLKAYDAFIQQVIQALQTTATTYPILFTCAQYKTYMQWLIKDSQLLHTQLQKYSQVDTDRDSASEEEENTL